MAQMFGICNFSLSGFDQSRPGCAKHPTAPLVSADKWPKGAIQSFHSFECG